MPFESDSDPDTPHTPESPFHREDELPDIAPARILLIPPDSPSMPSPAASDRVIAYLVRLKTTDTCELREVPKGTIRQLTIEASFA